jgi:3'-5' exonuclease
MPIMRSAVVIPPGAPRAEVQPRPSRSDSTGQASARPVPHRSRQLRSSPAAPIVCHPECHYDRGHHPDCPIACAEIWDGPAARNRRAKDIVIQQALQREDRRKKKEAGEPHPTWAQVDRRSRAKVEERRRKRRANHQQKRTLRKVAQRAMQLESPTTSPSPQDDWDPELMELEDAEQALEASSAPSPPPSSCPPLEPIPGKLQPGDLGAPLAYHPTPIAREPVVALTPLTITKTIWMEPRKRAFPIPLQPPSEPLPIYTQEPDERDPDKPTKSAKRRTKQKEKEFAVLRRHYQAKATTPSAAASASDVSNTTAASATAQGGASSAKPAKTTAAGSAATSIASASAAANPSATAPSASVSTVATRTKPRARSATRSATGAAASATSAAPSETTRRSQVTTAAAAARAGASAASPPENYDDEAPDIPKKARRQCQPLVDQAQARIQALITGESLPQPTAPIAGTRTPSSRRGLNFDRDCPLHPGFKIFWSRAYACTKEKGSPTASLNSLVQGVPLTDFPRNRLTELLSPAIEIEGDKVRTAFNSRLPPTLTDQGQYRHKRPRHYTTIVRSWNAALGVCNTIRKQNYAMLALDTETTQNKAEIRTEMIQLGTPAPEAWCYLFDLRACPALLSNPESPLRDILSDPAIRLVTHAGHNDARHLLERHQLDIGNYLDTSRLLSDLVMAAMPELPDTTLVSMTYEELCRLMGAPINMPPPGMKKHFLKYHHISYFGSNYTPEQGFSRRIINYAAGDVLNLCEMVRQLQLL